ncbi:MAG: DUF7453 family protein [Rubrobacter sp.]
MVRRDRAVAASEERDLAYSRSATLRLLAVALALVVGLAVALGSMLQAAEAAPSGEYRFVKVADSADDGFDPFSFGCSTINTRGDVAFRAGRMTGDGFDTVDGIYRANADGRPLTTIVENGRRYDFVGRNPSMNDSGEVSFAARLEREDRQTGDAVEKILRGDGRRLITIASTEDRFNFFGFDTSVNNDGVVAFKAELDERFGFDEGLFSGSGGRVTTHYLASTSPFDGTDSRPSINDAGRIAFEERRNGDQGIFVTRKDGGFKTIAEADPDGFVGEPVLNNEGTGAFETSFVDEASGEFVTEIVKGEGGELTTVADTRGPFGSFGFRPPSLNDEGDVAFLATLDDFSTTGIFVGPDAAEDRVIATGDALDGSTVQNLTFCEEGLSDTGRLAFVADLEDLDSPDGFRTAVVRASPTP